MFILYIRAFLGLLTVDLLLSFTSFSTLHKRVRSWKVAPGGYGDDRIQRVCRAVNYVCIFYPKQVLCLQRAALTTCLLRSYGVQAEMVLGAQKLPFKAHAWVEVNEKPVNERTDVQAAYGVWERC